MFNYSTLRLISLGRKFALSVGIKFLYFKYQNKRAWKYMEEIICLFNN